MKRWTPVAIIGPIILAIGTTGIATAAWPSTGSGAVSAHAATAQNSTITAVSAVALYPGASKTALVSIDNPNPYPVVVTSIAAGTSSAQLGGLGTCPANQVTSEALVPASGATAVPQSDGTTVTIPASGTGTYQLVTHMVADADNACQGLTFSLPLTATIASNA